MVQLDKSLRYAPSYVQDIIQTLQEESHSVYQLIWQDQRLQLLCPDMLPLVCDFTQGEYLHRIQSAGIRGELVAKAVNFKKYPNANVLDITAGMGHDGFILATVGANIHFVERNPVVASMLADGLERAKLNSQTAEAAERCKITFEDSERFLNRNKTPVDIIHIDPMFPERKKSAQVKKSMSVFHQIVGKDMDAGDLLKAARQFDCKKIIVKRPNAAPFLGDIKPSSQVKSKKHRYDVYLPIRSTT
jgi:16S rRNA (guanine1516-N2)-methyltransferase